MISNKYFQAFLLIAASAGFGFLVSLSNGETIVLKNRPSVIKEEIGNLENNIIPSVKIPKNITFDFAKDLTEELISLNNEAKEGMFLPGSGVNMPDPEKVAQDFIANGLQKANENIFNIAPPKLKISSDNSDAAVENYFSAFQTVINNNMRNKGSLFGTIEEIQKNNGGGSEKILPFISAHEMAANEIENIPTPSSIKEIAEEEIRLLRITANILKPLTNIDNDPVAVLASGTQFIAIFEKWQAFQKKMDNFVKNFNRQ